MWEDGGVRAIASTVARLPASASDRFGSCEAARYKAGGLPRLVAEINASGYGLTMGLHSRIDETAKTVRELSHAGGHKQSAEIILVGFGGRPHREILAHHERAG